VPKLAKDKTGRSLGGVTSIYIAGFRALKLSEEKSVRMLMDFPANASTPSRR